MLKHDFKRLYESNDIDNSETSPYIAWISIVLILLVLFLATVRYEGILNDKLDGYGKKFKLIKEEAYKINKDDIIMLGRDSYILKSTIDEYYKKEIGENSLLINNLEYYSFRDIHDKLNKDNKMLISEDVKYTNPSHLFISGWVGNGNKLIIDRFDSTDILKVNVKKDLILAMKASIICLITLFSILISRKIAETTLKRLLSLLSVK